MGIGQRLMQIGIPQIKHLFLGRFDVQEKACPILVEKPLTLLGLNHDFVIDLQVQLRTKGLDKSSSVPEPMGGKIRCFGGGVKPAMVYPQTLHPFELSPLILPHQFFPDPVLCAESGPVVFNP